MSKAFMPITGNQPPIAPPPGSYESALLYNLFTFLDDVAQDSPKRTLERVRRAVLGKSIEDAVYVQELVSRLLLAVSPTVDVISKAVEFYEHLSEQEEVLSC